MRTRDALLITCEHGGNRIPAKYRALFAGQKALLASHRGYDPGALRVATLLGRALDAPLVASTVSRLLIDLNRSISHPRVFSAVTRPLTTARRSAIVAEHYLPYRAEVERYVRQQTDRGRRVVHISSHSFTPVLDGRIRHADVGLLYDPRRRSESVFCARWKAALALCAPALRVRRNYPYAGKGDGLTAHLRAHFPPHAYLGVELEINQGTVVAAGAPWSALRRALSESLRESLRACVFVYGDK